jgi:excisionase family DNA binding protein
MPTGLLTIHDVAEIFEVSDETVRRWVADGRLRHIRLPSGGIRFEPEDIEAIRRPVEPVES